MVCGDAGDGRAVIDAAKTGRAFAPVDAAVAWTEAAGGEAVGKISGYGGHD